MVRAVAGERTPDHAIAAGAPLIIERRQQRL
jgi:hypothetical protein